jgi:hypothetical protein
MTASPTPGRRQRLALDRIAMPGRKPGTLTRRFDMHEQRRVHTVQSANSGAPSSASSCARRSSSCARARAAGLPQGSLAISLLLVSQRTAHSSPAPQRRARRGVSRLARARLLREQGQHGNPDLGAV